MPLAAKGTGGTFDRLRRVSGVLLCRSFLTRSLGLGSLLCLGRFQFLEVSIAEHGDPAITSVTHHLMHNFCHLGLEFLYKLLSIVFLMFDVAEFLFPDSSKFTALQEFLTDEVDELDACWGSDEALAVTLDIVPLEKPFISIISYPKP